MRGLQKIIIGIVVFGAVAFIGTSAHAVPSQITQEITSDLCDSTTYDTGYGRVSEPFCVVFAPSVTRYDASEGNLVFYGAYDSTRTMINLATGERHLQVQVGGVVYSLGVDDELQVHGNAWWLDLSERREEFDDAITRTIRVTTIMVDGRRLLGEATFRVGDDPDTPPPTPTPPVDGGTTPVIPGAPNTGIGQTTVFGILTVLIISVIGAIIAILKRVSREKK